MPTPDQKSPSSMPTLPATVFPGGPTKTFGLEVTKEQRIANLETEVSALRATVEEFRQVIESVPGLIATGQAVIAEYERLKGASNG